jgi:RES domain-containing protein
LTVTAYRIVKEKYRTSIWSGIGARDNPGRWNSLGIAVIYAAENRSLAALEQLVHLVKPRILNAYLIASIRFSDTQIRRVTERDLPKGWDKPVAPPELKRFGDELVARGAQPVLAVPSAVIRGEWNYLINPAHPDFKAMAKSTPKRFSFDNRLR